MEQGDPGCVCRHRPAQGRRAGGLLGQPRPGRCLCLPRRDGPAAGGRMDDAGRGRDGPARDLGTAEEEEMRRLRSASQEVNRMHTVKFVYWQEGPTWLGYIQHYPDYW